MRAVVLSGEGRAFCAGLDMGNFRADGVWRHAEAAPVLWPPPRTEARIDHRAQHAVMVWREIPRCR